MLEICWAFASSIFESQQHLAGSSAHRGPEVHTYSCSVRRVFAWLYGWTPFILPSPPHTHTHTNIPWRPKADLIPGLRLQKQTQNRTLEIIRKMEMEMKTYCRLKVMIIFCLHTQYQYWTLIVHFQFNQSWHFATLISVHNAYYIIIIYTYLYIYCTIYIHGKQRSKLPHLKVTKFNWTICGAKKLNDWKRERKKKRKEKKGKEKKNCFSSARGKINENWMKAKDFKNLLRWPLCVERCPTLGCVLCCGVVWWISNKCETRKRCLLTGAV